MIVAILEILVLLTVSCLIGIYFTYRFWRAKYKELQILDNEHRKKEAKLRDELRAAALKAEQQEKNLAQALEQNRIAREQELKARASEIKEAEKSNDPSLKKYEEEIAHLKIEMNEKERELEVVSDELDLRKISYYKHIDGKRYKASTIHMANEAIEGQGDGRISMEDAERIFDTVSNGTNYTQVEKHTIKYLRDNYQWTDQADALFRKKIRSWAASDHELID